VADLFELIRLQIGSFDQHAGHSSPQP
jgi:hypothetical protein